MNYLSPNQKHNLVFNPEIAVFSVDINYLLRFLVYQNIKLPPRENFREFPVSPETLLELDGVHLDLGSPTMQELPKLESGHERITIALIQRKRFIDVFLSGELEIALEFQIISKNDLHAFQNECLRLQHIEA